MVTYRRLEHNEEKSRKILVETYGRNKAAIRVLGGNCDTTDLMRKQTHGGHERDNSYEKAGPLQCHDKRRKN